MWLSEKNGTSGIPGAGAGDPIVKSSCDVKALTYCDLKSVNVVSYRLRFFHSGIFNIVLSSVWVVFLQCGMYFLNSSPNGPRPLSNWLFDDNHTCLQNCVEFSLIPTVSTYLRETIDPSAWIK